MKIFAVVVHWGDSIATCRTVSSLMNAAFPLRRIIVVENGMRWDAGNLSDTAIRIHLSHNRGYGGGANAGMRYAFAHGGDAALVLNNDLLFPKGALEAMEDHLRSSLIGCVGAIVDENDRHPIYGGGWVSWLTGRSHFLHHPELRHRLHYISGACMLIRREAFEHVGPIPEHYFHTWEDTAWSTKLVQSGWRIAYAKTPLIKHPRSHSLPDGHEKTYYLVRNGALFVREHASFIPRMWLLGIEPIRLYLAYVRGKREVVQGIRDARAGVTGPIASGTLVKTSSVTQKEYEKPSVKHSLHERPRISIIIPTHQSETTIAKCLSSVRSAKERYDNAEVIVADAGSKDNTVAVVRKTNVADRVICVSNLGFGSVANIGATAADGDILLFLNPDAHLPADALLYLSRSFCNRNIGITGCTLISSDGSAEGMQDTPYPSLWRLIIRSFHHYTSVLPVIQSSREKKSLLVSVPWVSGAAMAIRSDVFSQLHGFSKKYFLYFEDVDICRRVRMQGWTVALHTAIKVVHKKGESSSHPQRKFMYDRSRDNYFYQYRPRTERIILRLLQPLYRTGWIPLIAVISAVAGIYAFLHALVLAVAVLLFAVTVRYPFIGVTALIVSLLAGQSVRIPVGTVSATITDLMLPVVLLGLGGAVIRQKKLAAFFSSLLSGWWIVVALLPGIVLAVERLPYTDVLIALSYAARLCAVLLLIPLLRSLQLSFYTIRTVLITIAVVLSGIGILQLWLLPSLPVAEQTIVSTTFLGMSGGGWDPHQFRMFATWLDPNFLGGFFAVMTAVLLPIVMTGKKISAVYRVGSFMVFLLFLFSLMLTQSRASIVALFASVAVLGVLMAFSYRSRIFYPRFIVPIVGVGMVVLLLSPGIVGRLVPSPEGDPTLALRVQSWLQAVDHIRNYPLFGLGYNAYGSEQIATGNVTIRSLHSVSAADNALLTFFATTGLWGMALLTGGLSWTVRNLLARRNEEAALTVLLVLSALFAHTQFMQSITYIHLLVPLAILMGSVGSARANTV